MIVLKLIALTLIVLFGALFVNVNLLDLIHAIENWGPDAQAAVLLVQ